MMVGKAKVTFFRRRDPIVSFVEYIYRCFNDEKIY